MQHGGALNFAVGSHVDSGGFAGCTVAVLHADGSVDINIPGVGIHSRVARSAVRLVPGDGQQGRRRSIPWLLMVSVIACLVAFLVAQGNPWNSQSQPASVEKWNETMVADWLQGLGLSRTQFKGIASQFLEADVDGDELLEIDTIEELEELGIFARDTRLSRKLLLGDKLLSEIAKLRARVSQDPHNFWEWRAAHPFKGDALYLGARGFPRCTAATCTFSSRSCSSNWAWAGRRLDLGTVSSVGLPSCFSHTSPFSTMRGASARATGT